MKHNYKILIGVLIGIILSVSFTVVADTLIQSKDVNYSNSESGGTYADVQDAIDELYKRAGYTKEEYKEELLNGADPDLSDGMIPVYIADNGDVYYADSHTKWYSYKEKRWANAVILVDDAKSKYNSGDKIEESDIESYFVWIPRYAYKIWNLGDYNNVVSGSTLKDTSYTDSISLASNNARIIEVVFGTNDYLKSNLQNCKSLSWSSDTGAFSEPEGIKVGDYLQHPGFTLGETELNGLWVGKFKTGYNQSGDGKTAINITSSWTSQGAHKDENNSNKIIIKPNVYSWRNNSLSNIFNAALGYNTSLKSHMIKNTEWGAVAYLSHSAYGKGSEVNINNNLGYRTGYSAAPNSDQSKYPGDNGKTTDTDKTQPWNTAVGYLASTTGNITGVYDMSGGGSEFVAATMIGNGDKPTGDSSGFNSEDEILEKMKEGYIDVYPNDSTMKSFDKRILGDATGEIGPFYNYYDSDTTRYHNSWYADYAEFLDKDRPWFTRGGDFRDGLLAGPFRFVRSSGIKKEYYGSRVVLGVK